MRGLGVQAYRFSISWPRLFPDPAGGLNSRGAAFYDLFLDRRRWPELMRRGHEATIEALAPFRSQRRATRRAASARSRS